MASRTILVTGANRGIGFCMIQALAQRSPADIYILAARSQKSAEQACADLRQQGLVGNIYPIELDVTNDESIRKAVAKVDQEFGKLDVLVNNAGIGLNPQEDNSNFRETYNSVFNTNITSVGVVSTLFLPLLQKANAPRIINISSGRASMHALTTGTLPPTASISYSVSKTALNVLTLEMAKAVPNVTFYAATPGHCRTAFNGYKGKKDPLDGAKVVVELALADKSVYESGYWQHEDGKMSQMAW